MFIDYFAVGSASVPEERDVPHFSIGHELICSRARTLWQNQTGILPALRIAPNSLGG